MWHKRLRFKLRKAGISSKFFSWISDYVTNRHQSVVLPGFESNLSPINARVPKGSILGPLLFLVYINDIVNDIESNIYPFSDDTSLFMIVGNPNTAERILQTDINKMID